MIRPRFAPVLALAAALLICLALAACAPAAPAARANRNEVVVAVPAGIAAQALQSAVDRYTAAGGDTIRVEALAGEAYYDRVSAVLLSGQDSYDLVYLPADSTARWVQYNALRPISAEVDREALAPWLPALTYPADGSGTAQLFALPAQPDPLVLWYRADLVQAAGLTEPNSLEALRETALALNAPPERYGIAIAGSELNAGLDYAALLAGAPGDLLSAFTSAESQPHGREAMALFAELAAEGGVTDPRADELLRADVVTALAEGRAAMGFASLSSWARLLNCDASPKACSEGRPLLTPARLPGQECAVLENLSAWAVPLHAANPDAAGRFAAWLVSEEGARAFAAGGGLPAHTGVLSSMPRGEGDWGVWGRIEPVLGSADCYELAFPHQTAIDVLWKALHESAHAAAAGELTPDEAFDQAAREIRQGLREGESAP